MSFPSKKTSLARVLFVAGALAAAGAVAQAETFDSPQQAGEMSTMTHGAPNLETTNSPYGDVNHAVVVTTPGVVATAPVMVVPNTTVLGAGPAVVTTTTMPGNPYLHDGSSETSNTPQRAGEMSTMTGGAPNMLTQNPGSSTITTVTTWGPVYYTY